MKTFSLTENQFSGKTYFYTIRPSIVQGILLGGVRVDVEVLAPLYHALQDGAETLERLHPETPLERLAALGELREVVHEALKDVGGCQIAVVVDVDVYDDLRLRAHGRDALHDQPLLLERGARRRQNVEANLLEEYLDLRLEVLPVFRQERQEDGERELKDFADGRHAVLGQRHAQITFDGADKDFVGLESRAAILQHPQKQLEAIV